MSTGSACTTAKVEPSHVILALGYDEARAYKTARFGLGRKNTQIEVDTAITQVSESLHHLKTSLIPKAITLQSETFANRNR